MDGIATMDFMDPLNVIDQPIEVDKMCRCCLSRSEDLKSLFVASDFSLNLNEILMSFASVQINANDRLPSHICNNCIMNTNQVYSFKKQVEFSDQLLKQYFIKTESYSASTDNIVTNVKDLLTREIMNCPSCERKFINKNSLKKHTVICQNKNAHHIIENINSSPVSNCDELRPFVKLEIEEFKISNELNSSVNVDGCEKSDLQNETSTRRSVRSKVVSKVSSKKPEKPKKVDIVGDFIDKIRNSALRESDTVNQNLTRVTETVCIFCSKSFEDSSKLLQHIETEHDRRNPYPCTLCEAKFKKQNSLEVHIRVKHTKERALSCSQCSKTFIEQRDLNRHMKAHNKSLVCHICKKVFDLKFVLKNHIATHIESDKKICPECGLQFKNDLQLQKHSRVAHTDEEHKCSTCGKVFTHSSRLRKHKLNHRTADQRRFQCSFCSKTFNHMHHLTNHERTHTGIEPFLCSLCGKGFKQKYNLTAHMVRHDHDVKFSCDYCSKSYSTKDRLVKHIKRHNEGASIMTCSICDETFHNILELKSHTKSHFEDKAHSCSVCYQTFSSSLLLRNHSKSHSNKKKSISQVIERKTLDKRTGEMNQIMELLLKDTESSEIHVSNVIQDMSKNNQDKSKDTMNGIMELLLQESDAIKVQESSQITDCSNKYGSFKSGELNSSTSQNLFNFENGTSIVCPNIGTSNNVNTAQDKTKKLFSVDNILSNIVLSPNSQFLSKDNDVNVDAGINLQTNNKNLYLPIVTNDSVHLGYYMLNTSNLERSTMELSDLNNVSKVNIPYGNNISENN